MAKTMDRETLQRLMQGLTTNDRQLQREIADEFLTEDVRLVHFLGDVRGREAYYGVYRAAVTGIDYKLKFIETIISDDAAAVWVDLNIKLAPLYLKRYHVPTVVMLRFRRGEDGLVRICEQVDHHSLLVFVWALGWPFSSISDAIMRPLQGLLISRSGWLVDTAEDALSAGWAASRDSLAWLLAGNTLPASLVNTLLPAWLLQALGLTDESRQQPVAPAAGWGPATPLRAAEAASAAGQEQKKAAAAPGGTAPDQDELPAAAAVAPAEPAAANGHQPAALASEAIGDEAAVLQELAPAVEGTAGIIAAAAELVAEAAAADGPRAASGAAAADGVRGRQQYWSAT